MERKRVLVLMGGMSTEREVSLASGAKVVECLDRDRYEVIPVVITDAGLWQFPGDDLTDIFDAIPLLKQLAVDCVFIALHGAFGEDGRLQGLLDLVGIPYTSSGCAASAIAIDKVRSKALVRQAGIRVGRHVVLDAAAWDASPGAVLTKVEMDLGFPCVVKSPCQGSSVGMAIPQTPEDFPEAVELALAYDDVVMVEQFITGREVTCGVLDVDLDSSPVALPVTEILPVTSSYFDYHAKYTPGASEEITPADIGPDLTAKVQDIAEQVHRIVGCKIWSRSDFIIDKEGPVWIEVNTIPGLTPTSLYPQAAAVAGIPYGELMGMFIDGAVEARQRALEGQ